MKLTVHEMLLNKQFFLKRKKRDVFFCCFGSKKYEFNYSSLDNQSNSLSNKFILLLK